WDRAGRQGCRPPPPRGRRLRVPPVRGRAGRPGRRARSSGGPRRRRHAAARRACPADRWPGRGWRGCGCGGGGRSCAASYHKRWTSAARPQRRDRGKLLAFEELEERAATGGDVGDVAGDAVLVDGG